MSELLNLNPKKLWFFFDKFCEIPRPSKHEAALRAWIVQWAQEQQIDVNVDRAGNILLKKPATAGMENCKGVILQAHIDMVAQANADTPHDFTKDAIQPYIDGDWVKARGTTLGADNGIGAAACLAVLAEKNVRHGPLEVLLTVDEETGMSGAFGLEPGMLEGEILLNTDSEQDGEVFMGCAGGVDANLFFPMKRTPVPQGYVAYQLTIKGLRGGHSGVNIHQDRGNANKILARLLIELYDQIRLASIQGGTLRNAIPREASATFVIAEDQATAMQEQVAAIHARIANELKLIDANLAIGVTPTELPEQIFQHTEQLRVIQFLVACPNGVIRNSQAIAGVVETSINLGVITTEADGIHICCLIRSLLDEGRHHVEQMVASLAALANASCEFTGTYPGWEPDPQSPVLNLLSEKHQELFQTTPKIMVIHAGLECGLFKTQYPHWDMVSFGPTIEGAHSPDERVNIPTVARFWQLLVAMLAAIPHK
jgi:dipeptidase D